MTTLRDIAWWPGAIDNLRRLTDQHFAEAEHRAKAYGEVYKGRRAAMVYDVVASRQRRYESRVLPMVGKFEAGAAPRSLSDLAQAGPEMEAGLRRGEAETMRGVAGGLAQYCDEHLLSEDAGVRQWAEATADLEHAHRMEPYVGRVKGIGPALFAYLRMRSGADGIKPDLRVRTGLNYLGFRVPNDPHALLVVASAAAKEVGTSRIVLDQLLWWLDAD